MSDKPTMFRRVRGFDIGKGDEATVATFSYRGREWTLEELERISPHETRAYEDLLRREAMARQRAQDEEIMRAFYGSARPFVSDPPWGAPPRRNAVEIITDPNDRRGMDARQIGPRP